MQENDGLTPMERELEAALGGLQVTRTGMSRDQVMFDAGRDSGRRRRRLWQGASSVLALLLLVSILSRSNPRASEPLPEIIAHEPPAIQPAAGGRIDFERAQAFREYIRTRRAVLDEGFEVAPASSGVRQRREPPLTRKDLDDLLAST